ncbi:reverse transcriptase zinc-binding domain-containing protein [Artemisia annua]|uniref:Reverse transcriptase zinc-binding domain-containing protein n=1 Tax=Artemisia annua TaxID=35608 RepID=A0A2U1M6T8_ARTAN|nr:reverse transcriptase zinc-binding domain-containing protein [Artemisia annua]
MDSHQHLFFSCNYSQKIWGKITQRLQMDCHKLGWNDIVKKFAECYNGKNIDSIVRRLCLAASVYHVWQERNKRLFSGELRNEEEVYNLISEAVRLRLMSLKVKLTKATSKIQIVWSDKLVLVVSDMSQYGKIENMEVKWNKVVWYTQNIPKYSFILWLAIQNKLTTQDKIKSWGSYDLMRLQMDCHKLGWNDIVKKFAECYNGKNIDSIVRRLCLAASVYHVWQERNKRLFSGELRNEEEVYNLICEAVRLRLMSLKVKLTKATSKIQRVWDIQLNIISQ